MRNIAALRITVSSVQSTTSRGCSKISITALPQSSLSDLKDYDAIFIVECHRNVLHSQHNV